MNLTKPQIKEKLHALSSNEQIEQPSESELDDAFLELVYHAQSTMRCELSLGVCNEDFDHQNEGRDFFDAYMFGQYDGIIGQARLVLKNLFGIDLELLKQLLS